MDIQSADPLGYANVGSNELSIMLNEIEVYDIRREQLGNAREHTKQGGGVCSRLDRWYVPMQDDMAHVLWNVQVTQTS